MKFAKQFGKDAVVSWKTTVGGIVAFIAILAPQMQTLLDNDAATNPDWNLIIAAASVLMAALFARDADKSTEDSR
jgi:ABC-type enterobactin transport system permease subunit